MIIVTGATGHLGNVLVKRLVKEGYKVGIIAHNKPPREIMGDIDYTVFNADVTSYSTLIEPFKNAEIVFHLAAKISITSGEYDELYKVNVEGTANIVRACLEQGVKKLVYVSTVHTLEEKPMGIPIIEEVIENTSNAFGDYSKSKILAYKEVMNGVKKGLKTVIVFPTGIVGPFDYRPSQIGQMVRDFLAKKPIRYLDGAYDYVDVRDVVNGIMLAFNKGRNGEGYLLSGHAITVKEMYEVLKKVSGINVKMFKIPTFLALFLSYFAEAYSKLIHKEALFTPYSIRVLQSNPLISSDKARNELGYIARPFEQTIKDEIGWFKGEKIDIY